MRLDYAPYLELEIFTRVVDIKEAPVRAAAQRVHILRRPDARRGTCLAFLVPGPPMRKFAKPCAERTQRTRTRDPERYDHMNCRQVMNNSIRVCHTDDTVSACADVLRRDSVPLLAVLDSAENLVGLLTRRRAIAESYRGSPARVADVMTTKLVICTPETAVDKAARLLVTSNTPAILVETDGQLLGWVSAAELAGATRTVPKRSARNNDKAA